MYASSGEKMKKILPRPKKSSGKENVFSPTRHKKNIKPTKFVIKRYREKNISQIIGMWYWKSIVVFFLLKFLKGRKCTQKFCSSWTGEKKNFGKSKERARKFWKKEEKKAIKKNLPL